MKHVSLLFALVSRRKTTDYVAVFQEMLRQIPADPEVTEIVVDFERADWSGLKKCCQQYQYMDVGFTGHRPCTRRYVTIICGSLFSSCAI